MLLTTLTRRYILQSTDSRAAGGSRSDGGAIHGDGEMATDSDFNPHHPLALAQSPPFWKLDIKTGMQL